MESLGLASQQKDASHRECEGKGVWEAANLTLCISYTNNGEGMEDDRGESVEYYKGARVVHGR
jgi:hypothetical protein